MDFERPPGIDVLQREIEEGLNVVESSNRANDVIAYGNRGTIASNRRDEANDDSTQGVVPRRGAQPARCHGEPDDVGRERD